VIVKIGGGKQSIAEFAAAKQMNKICIEYALEPLNVVKTAFK
jgi:hypothetical protein